jgi:hypothetical protein
LIPILSKTLHTRVLLAWVLSTAFLPNQPPAGFPPFPERQGQALFSPHIPLTALPQYDTPETTKPNEK